MSWRAQWCFLYETGSFSEGHCQTWKHFSHSDFKKVFESHKTLTKNSWKVNNNIANFRLKEKKVFEIEQRDKSVLNGGFNEGRRYYNPIKRCEWQNQIKNNVGIKLLNLLIETIYFMFIVK